MNTNPAPRSHSRDSHRPLYKRRKFWLAVAAVGLVAAGIATFFLTKQAGLSLDTFSRPTDQAGLGQVEIYTAPEGATIIVDGQERREKSPATFSLPPGEHTITLTLDGYDDATIPITLVEGTPAIIEQTFTKDGQLSADEEPGQFRTYTNDRYRYRIQHPSNWEPEVESPELVNFTNRNRAAKPEARLPFGPLVETALAHSQASLSILVQPNPGNLSPAEWYRARQEYAHEDQSQIKTRELTIGGRPAFQFETPYGFVPYVNTVVTGNGQAFLLQQLQGSPERGTYDQVIQTFVLF